MIKMFDSAAFYFPDEEHMLHFGRQFARELQTYLASSAQHSLVIYLEGELGVGKTTLTRSIVRAFGHQGNVKSPTYTLVEEYNLPPFKLYHFDLYRLADSEELEFMGIRDYFQPQTLCLLEWAKKGNGMIPAADIVIRIEYAKEGRNITLLPQNQTGLSVLVNFKANSSA